MGNKPSKRVATGTPTFCVVGNGAGSGKTTTAKMIAEILGREYFGSSQCVAWALEDEKGWERGTVAKDRAIDRDAHRPELNRKAKEMIDAGNFPTIEAVNRGADVTEGARWGRELKAWKQFCLENDRRPIVIMVLRAGAENTDKVQPTELVLSSDWILPNEGSLEDLEQDIKRILIREGLAQEVKDASK